jgi:hypothetical protein
MNGGVFLVLEMTDEARAERNAYYREWYKKNREKVRASQREYWERRAAGKKEAKKHEATDK